MEIDVYAEYAGYLPSFTEVSNFLLSRAAQRSQ
jgi:hypothetical protein